MARVGNVGRSYWKQQCGMILRYNNTLCSYSEPKVGNNRMWKMKLVRNDIGSALPYMLRKTMELQSMAKFYPIGVQYSYVNMMLRKFFKRTDFLWRMGVVRTAATNNKAFIEVRDEINVRTFNMFVVFQIKKGWSPDINNLSQDRSLRHPFLEQRHNVKLENFGLYKKGNNDWHVAGGSRLRYISIEDFMWCFYRIPEKHKKGIYNYMLKQQICVLENSPVTLLKHSIFVGFWEAPDDGWYKLNVCGVFKENLDGTIEACCGAVLRDSRGTVLEVFHKPLLDATSRNEVLSAGVHYGLHKILSSRSEAKKIIVELDQKAIVNVLRSGDLPLMISGRTLSSPCVEHYEEMIKMMKNFYDVNVRFQDPHGNNLANRVAFIASHLTTGQSFPICEIGYETQVMCDKWETPKYEIIPKTRSEVEESFDYDEAEECTNDDQDDDEDEECSEDEYCDEVL